MLDDLRNQHSIGDFLIVAPEGRRSFYINSADGAVRYSDFFPPGIPALYRKQVPDPLRPHGSAISGISMGGYGAFRFAFAHPELFSAVSAQSAALITESPRALDTASSPERPWGVFRSVRRPHQSLPLERQQSFHFGEKKRIRSQKDGHLFQLRPR